MERSSTTTKKANANEGGALIVSLGVDDQLRIDSYQGANITSLVATPEGDFLVSHVKFGARFVRSYYWLSNGGFDARLGRSAKRRDGLRWVAKRRPTSPFALWRRSPV